MKHDFPIFRLLALVIRQVGAPIAARIKAYELAHPAGARRSCAAAGRAYIAFELRARSWALGVRAPPSAPLPERAALEAGASLLGDAAVLGACAGFVLREAARQARRRERQALTKESEWVALLAQVEEQRREVVLQQQDIERLAQQLRRLTAAS